ncbi:bZIP transcription factor ABI5 homolog [Oryza brachyantha]|uniref:bZIP transcription factor ABI5 homolog n=1 Tax=Oryza brachyantha TaxID=4533 RepID=UPI001ADB9039|nr:bZIP transcription factor ABI5 homolog [Oryza brachyantha]
MASEMSKNMKAADDQEVTSQERDQSGGTKADGEEQVAPLARQSSILSLTLEELQNSLCEPGRNFGSMNMDEFVANIWNAEEFQAATGGCKGAMEETKAVGAGGGDAGGSGLCRQGSFSLPLPLCQKTVEEVWAEINQAPAHTSAQAPAQQLVQPQARSGGVTANGRQVTLGEMTLEDFLVKAGVVRGSFSGQAPMAAGMVHGPVNPMQQGQAGPMMFPMAPANTIYPVMGDGMGYPGGYNGMAVVPPPPPAQGAIAALSPGSSDGMSAMTHADMMNCIGNGMIIENGTRKRPHREDGCAEKTVERRQRRMIKNRESAARSRARKQAYTVELEAELNYLKQENARLRDAEKTILLTKKQMLVEKMMEQSKEKMNAKKGGSQLRRCGSCVW